MSQYLKIPPDNWQHVGTHSSRPFICGYCGKDVASRNGYYCQGAAAYVYICPNCGCPSFFHGTQQTPGPTIGREIGGLTEDIAEVYREMRDSAKNGCHTAVIMLGRKLIMHIAVEAGAEEGKTFAEYITYLGQQHYTPPNAEPLLDYMRKLGNEKNHEIKLGTTDESQKIIKFVESLLYFVYELKSEFDDASDNQSNIEAG